MIKADKPQVLKRISLEQKLAEVRAVAPELVSRRPGRVKGLEDSKKEMAVIIPPDGSFTFEDLGGGVEPAPLEKFRIPVSRLPDLFAGERDRGHCQLRLKSQDPIDPVDTILQKLDKKGKAPTLLSM